MSRQGKALAAAVAIGIAFWLIWSRLRIVVWVQASLWQVLLGFVVLVVVLFLAIDHLLNRTKS
jgi:type VI protein secretion system component VasF